MRSVIRRPNSIHIRHVINDHIRGEQFRLIDALGDQVGLVSRDKALAYAQEHGIDLVLIAAHAQPPVVKAIDYHKFLYQEEKKNREGRKGQKKGGTKDIQLSLFIGEQDLERLARKSQEFLAEGYQVRVKLRLKGREMGKQDMAHEHTRSFIARLGEVSLAVEPKLQGRMIMAVVVRKK